MSAQQRIVLVLGVSILVGAAPPLAVAQPKPATTKPQPKPPPKKPDSCSVIRPWTSAGGDIVAPKTASTAYQGIATKWAVDSVYERRELTAFLASKPNLLGTLSGAAAGCPRGGCVCPVPPKLVQTAQNSYVIPLDVAYRADSAGTSAAAALFLSRHPWLVTQLYDSVARLKNSTQANVAIKANMTAKTKIQSSVRPPLQ